MCVEDPNSEHWIYDWQALSKFSNARASLIVEAVSLVARAGVEQQCAQGREMVCLKPASLKSQPRTLTDLINGHCIITLIVCLNALVLGQSGFFLLLLFLTHD